MSEIINPQSEIVYHYTNIDALICILRKDDIQLRATSCIYLNDEREIFEGVEALRRSQYQIQISDMDFRHIFSRVFVTSFSKENDSLPMWGMYAADGGGCAIGFDLNILKQKYEHILECEYGEDNIDQKFAIRTDPKNATTLFKSGFGGTKSEEELHSRLVELGLELTCITSKNSKYCFENEYRGIIRNYNETHEVFYKNRKGVIVPYINISIPKEALRIIVIGPTNNFHSQLSVANFLAANKYDHERVKLIASEVPYRG